MHDARNVYLEGFHAGLRPDPLLTVSEWADNYRVLSQTASAEPGRFRTERTPYLRAIMDALAPTSPVERVVFMKGAQVGGTEAGNNWIGYVIDQAPGPMLVVQPTVEMGKRWSKGRLAPLITDTPVLSGKIQDPRSRDSGNTVQSKEFTGGIIVVTGANSAVGLRSMPVRYLFLDEVDAYPGDADGEGDPVSLAIQRTSTFSRRKMLMVSTPTIQGVSRIEREYEASNKQRYYVPCPHCDYYQTLEWAQLTWKKGIPSSVKYRCKTCDYKIANHEKTAMLARGEWRAELPDITKVAGFHLSSLYSPVGWFGWEQAVESFLAAQGSEQLLKVWVNTTLGECWVDRGEAPDWQRLFERSEDYAMGTVPKGGIILTAGVDVQKDRLEVEIVAWGKGKESWSVEYQVLDGDPAKEDVWRKLDKVLNTYYPHENGATLPITMLAIDAGYATQEVYRWVRKTASPKVLAIKGVEKALMPLGSPSRVDVTVGGMKLKRGVKLWPVGVSILKSELYSWLKLNRNEETSPPGYCHFPKYAPEYFKQLTAEQLVTKMVKGYPKREWQKLRDRNEALDCRIYARAASIALGIERWNDAKWQQLEKQLVAEEDKIQTKVTSFSPSLSTNRRKQRVSHSNWMR